MLLSQDVARMAKRLELVLLSQSGGISFKELCRRFRYSRKTGYKWLGRYRREGAAGLLDRSRKPHTIKRRVALAIEQEIVQMRLQHPAWGARKIRRRLQDGSGRAVPACSTLTAIFHRHGLIDLLKAGGRKDWQRFEHPVPNSLWQMDFKGAVTTLAGPAHPLTILDDCSRFNLCLFALPNQKTATVQKALTETFRRWGLPDVLLVDNGSPWGSDAEHPYTPLGVWILRLGVGVSHSRPYHPQTLGKDERFHRTLKQELLNDRQWQSLQQFQEALERWQRVYNFERPHEALGLEVPAVRYQPSLRSFPETLPPIEYPAEAAVRKVQAGGEFFFRGAT